VGQAVAGLHQVNRALYDLNENIDNNRGESNLHEYLASILNSEKETADNVNFIHKIIKPLGVYNNRGTHG
tara:strand:- start:479 stop:688 length:210 start_codon:yes stop_codon:yes gene_type:complete